MPGKTISTEVKEQVVKLHRLGKKNAEISRQLTLDPRTVKKVVETEGKLLGHIHWEAVSIQVDARVLESHYREVIELAEALQREINSKVEENNPAQRGEEALASRFKEAFSHPEYYDVGGQNWGMIRYNRPLNADRIKNLGCSLLKGMTEHEPELGKALEKWTASFDRLQEKKRELLGEVESWDAKDVSVADKVVSYIIQELVEVRVQKMSLRTSEIMPLNDGRAMFNRCRPEDTPCNVATEHSDKVKKLSEKYEAVVSRLIESEKGYIIESIYKEITRWRDKANELIDNMVLRGKPSGRCSVCPTSTL